MHEQIKRASDLNLKRLIPNRPTACRTVSNVCLYWQAIIHVHRRGINIIHSGEVEYMLHVFFHMVVKENEHYDCQCVGRCHFSGISAEPVMLSCLSSRWLQWDQRQNNNKVYNHVCKPQHRREIYIFAMINAGIDIFAIDILSIIYQCLRELNRKQNRMNPLDSQTDKLQKILTTPRQ